VKRTLQYWNGAGNDFLVDVLGASESSPWDGARAAAVCDRTSGLGADGLLVATPQAVGWVMTLFNADGSTAEMSGNGIRCFAAAVLRASGERSPLRVHTAAGLRVVTLVLDGESGRGAASMGRVRLQDPIAGVLGVANVGNPHVVVRDQASWTTADREALAHRYAADVGGANVEFVTKLHPARVRIVVYERGVGWTRACGTGSVATAAVLHALGETGSDVVVENPGGELVVHLVDGEATLEGPVDFDGDRTWEL
jgi:diaminopimelate epimerase